MADSTGTRAAGFQRQPGPAAAGPTVDGMAGAFQNIVSVSWDTSTGEVTVLRSDGRQLSGRLSPIPSDPAVRVEADFQAAELVLVFGDSDKVVASLADEDSARQHVSTRPVVYLDQCYWSTVAKHLGEGNSADEEALAAVRLAELATANRIVLPFSSGHMLETGPLAGPKRPQLVLTMLGLCGGWFMRDPLEIRRMELVASMQGPRPEQEDIFGINPGDLHRDLMPSSPRDFPPELARIHARTVEVLSVYHTLAEDSPIPESAAGEAASRSWAEANHQTALAARRDGMSREQVDKLATQLLLMDHRDDIAEAAMSCGLKKEEFAAWLSSADDGLRPLPMLSRFREVLLLRLRNADERWDSNDLVDMLYLSAAAGYADVVVGERRMANYLSAASASVPAGAFVTRKLPEAVEHIERLLAGQN